MAETAARGGAGCSGTESGSNQVLVLDVVHPETLRTKPDRLAQDSDMKPEIVKSRSEKT
jgi:hypothetical protein